MKVQQETGQLFIQALNQECVRVIARAAQYDITLTRGDFDVIDDELFIDGMDPNEWIDAMIMD